MKRSMPCLIAAFAILAATSCGNNDGANGTRNADTSSVTGGDAGTKGTGSAGVAPSGDAGTKGTGSAGLAPGGDAGTKGTGSAGSDSTPNNNNR